jgi:hypothetical protein
LLVVSEHILFLPIELSRSKTKTRYPLGFVQ